MSVDTIIRAALDAGVKLSFVDGRLKANGKRKAVECWAPRLAASKAALIEALTAPPEHQTPIDWKPLAELYHTHHYTCATCIAAGRGARYGLRCGTGATLWAGYQQAAASTKNTP